MLVEQIAPAGNQHVRKIIQPPMCRDARLKLAHRSGSRVSGIRKQRQALLLTLIVHSFNEAIGISISPRASKSAGMPAFFSFSLETESGTDRTVRTFEVTSSPVEPSP